MIPAAFEMGINFFFITTDMHWPLYEANRKGIKALLASCKGIRDDVVVAGVCYPAQPEFSIAPFYELVQALPGLKHVDVLVAGGVYGPDLLSRVRVMRKIERGNSACAVGASFHNRQAAIDAANHRIVDLCYVRYNPAHPTVRHDMFPFLQPKGPPMFNFKSMRGFVSHEQLRTLNIDPELWYPDPPDYYRYALSRAQMDGLLFAVARRRELAELDAAMKLGGLTPSEEDHLDELAVLTKQTDVSMR
jgi:hypothetical protein